IVKNNSGKKIGEVYTEYQKTGGEMSYKSFQRRILKLRDGKFIHTKKTQGIDGNSTLLNYSTEKKLSDF
ncbi:TPA: hypothetical protein HA278_00355, partial [Candidatus Woesearchaeota archaeon]|nr:hypothetical protein [Candidatus Woesearchaeota archaeon]